MNEGDQSGRIITQITVPGRSLPKISNKKQGIPSNADALLFNIRRLAQRFTQSEENLRSKKFQRYLTKLSLKEVRKIVSS